MNHQWIKASQCLQGDGVAGFPTETVYGLGADPSSCAAVSSLISLKRRDSSLGLPLVVSSPERLEQLEIDESSEEKKLRIKLISNHWPGPLTIVLKVKNSAFSSKILAPDGTIAVRYTSHIRLQELSESVGGFLIATSANITKQPVATSKKEFLTYFPNILFVDEFSPLNSSNNLASTIVKVVESEIVILRQGVLSL